MAFDLDREDWRGFNRLRFWVRPQILGARILHLNVSVVSQGAVPVPDPYFREGATVFDLENGDWQECIWEFAAMPRDAVTQLCFYVFCSGHDISAGESLCYDFKDVCLEQAENPEHELGWENPNPGIRLSSAGYFSSGNKTAVAAGAGEAFRLVDADSGREVFSGPVERVENPRGRFEVLDFSEFAMPGRYILKSGGLESPAFGIGGTLREEALWKAVNFFYCQRCGFPVPGKHSACHQDILAHHNGAALSYSGGWHDAGDQSQQSAQTGEIVQARVHDHSFENFLFSGVEAFASGALRGYDDGLAECALKAAREDFAFAQKKFALTGVEPAHMFEHTYNSGLSQYYAVIVWAASCLFEATGEKDYAGTAREYAGKLLSCQEQGEAGIWLAGFFYRDESHRTVVHFNHQARELFPYLHVTCEYDRERENYREQLLEGKDLGGGYVLRNFPVWFSFRGNGAVMLSMGKAAGILGRYFKDRELTQLAKEQLYWMWGKNPFGQSLVYGMGSNYCRQYAVLTGESAGEVPVGVETLGNGGEPY